MKSARRSVFLIVLAVALLATAAVPAFADGPRTFRAHLTGRAEVPARDTLAQGQAFFKLSKDGASLEYKLIVANIYNVTAAHIHSGAAGVNGPVAVPLFGPAPAGGGRSDGVIAAGTITAANLTGPLAGGTLADLLALLESGNAYVNVHTNDGVAPTNTGPGDFPGGEIRGQIRGDPVAATACAYAGEGRSPHGDALACYPTE